GAIGMGWGLEGTAGAIAERPGPGRGSTSRRIGEGHGEGGRPAGWVGSEIGHGWGWGGANGERHLVRKAPSREVGGASCTRSGGQGRGIGAGGAVGMGGRLEGTAGTIAERPGPSRGSAGRRIGEGHGEGSRPAGRVRTEVGYRWHYRGANRDAHFIRKRTFF